jgi:zinc transport system ATP-binding protein
MSPPLVSIRNLFVHLGGNDILKGLNADIARGQITALIGLNGSGKTTLLRAILKEVPYAGLIEFHCGHDHTHPSPQHVGYVPQKLRFDANMPLTVRDLLAMALQRRPRFLGISGRVRRIMDGLMERVGAPLALLDRPVEKISGGELQRVLLGLAMQPEPELLLLDEPAAGIDFAHQEHFYDLLARLNRERGVTILLVSHDLTIVSDRAHHVLCMKDGRIHCQGAPKDIDGEKMQETFGFNTGVFAHRHDH